MVSAGRRPFVASFVERVKPDRDWTRTNDRILFIATSNISRNDTEKGRAAPCSAADGKRFLNDFFNFLFILTPNQRGKNLFCFQ
jgi:hypothetical protein